jgi:hypothetical protein
MHSKVYVLVYLATGTIEIHKYTVMEPKLMPCAGHWIILKLPKPIFLTKIQFHARQDDIFGQGGSNRAPGKFKVYGSRDGIKWVQIFDYTATKLVYPKDSFRSGYLRVTPTATGYQYIGVVVSSLALANSEATVIEIVEWEIYGIPYGCAEVRCFAPTLVFELYSSVFRSRHENSLCDSCLLCIQRRVCLLMHGVCQCTSMS